MADAQEADAARIEAERAVLDTAYSYKNAMSEDSSMPYHEELELLQAIGIAARRLTAPGAGVK